jgi:Xaa-Pro aminopeptidase
MIIGEGIEISEFQSRRQRVLDELKDGIAIVFAGDGAPPLSGHWTPDWNFYYLTGIRDEPGAAVFFDPKNPDPKRRAILFLKPLNPEIEEWDGYRDRVSAKLKQQTGFETVMRTYALPRTLTAAARRGGAGRLVCLHPFTVYDAPVSPDLAVFRKVLERSVGIRLDERTNLLASMRSVKSKAEIAIMERAAAASAEGYRAAAAAIRPGAAEREVQLALEAGFSGGGGVGTGYNSIVGSGLNTTVLHYNINVGTLEAGDLLLIDAGARVGAYTADVTRTFPVNGRFDKDQRDIYEIVLGALKAATKAARPGATFADLDSAARTVIDKAGYGDNYIHGIGHHLGIEVHDVTPDGPLKAGNIITIEPGIYLPDRKIGIRLEDDILITARGPRNLTEAIPREASEVEAMMAGDAIGSASSNPARRRRRT